jgi:hypothetical protein
VSPLPTSHSRSPNLSVCACVSPSSSRSSLRAQQLSRRLSLMKPSTKVMTCSKRNSNKTLCSAWLGLSYLGLGALAGSQQTAFEPCVVAQQLQVVLYPCVPPCSVHSRAPFVTDFDQVCNRRRRAVTGNTIPRRLRGTLPLTKVRIFS